MLSIPILDTLSQSHSLSLFSSILSLSLILPLPHPSFLSTQCFPTFSSIHSLSPAFSYADNAAKNSKSLSPLSLSLSLPLMLPLSLSHTRSPSLSLSCVFRASLILGFPFSCYESCRRGTHRISRFQQTSESRVFFLKIQSFAKLNEIKSF